MAYLEHANLTVRNMDQTVAFLKTAMPEFEIRGRGTGVNGRWLHIGTQQTYLALEEASQDESGPRARYRDPGFNHVGFVVDDADDVRRWLLEAGYKESIKVPPHPYRKRIYFFDHEGNEYEFVEYLSDDPAERNDYSLPI